MDQKSIVRFIVFILLWINTFLTAHNVKTIPVLDDAQVAYWLAFIISAYEWGKHSYLWIQKNWIKKQPDPAPAPAAQKPTQEQPKEVAAPIAPEPTATPAASPQTAAAPEVAAQTDQTK